MTIKAPAQTKFSQAKRGMISRLSRPARPFTIQASRANLLAGERQWQHGAELGHHIGRVRVQAGLGAAQSRTLLPLQGRFVSPNRLLRDAEGLPSPPKKSSRQRRPTSLSFRFGRGLRGLDRRRALARSRIRRGRVHRAQRRVHRHANRLQRDYARYQRLMRQRR